MTRQGLAYAGAAVLLWSTVASAFKLSLQYLDPLQLLLFSNAVSVLVLFTVLAVQGRIDRLRQQTAAAWWRLAGLGVLNPFLYASWSLGPGWIFASTPLAASRPGWGSPGRAIGTFARH